MKQSKTLRRISVAIVAVLLITMSVLSVTLAKYTTTFTGTDSLTIAKWDVDVNGTTAGKDTNQFTLNLVPTTTNYNHVASDTNGLMLAPGASGQFEVEITNESNVDVEYTMSFTAATKPTNLKFYYQTKSGETITRSDTVITNNSDIYEYSFNSDGTTNDGKLVMGSETETIIVYWVWLYDTDSTVTTDDQEDTNNGIDAGAMTVTVTLTATQANPSTDAWTTEQE